MIDIIMPTWNNWDQCLEALNTFSERVFVDCEYHIHVVNNGEQCDLSGNDYAGIVGTPNITVHCFGENLGWCKSLNTLYQMTSGEYFFTMNDDLVFLPCQGEFLTNLLEHFVEDDVGAVGPSGTEILGYQNIHQPGMPLIFQQKMLVGFCALYRRAALDEIAEEGGPWDENLLMGDDFDLSIRLSQHNWRMIVDRRSFVLHIGAQTNPRVYDLSTSKTREDQVRAYESYLIRKHGYRPFEEVRHTLAYIQGG